MPGSMKSNESHEIRTSSQVQRLLSNTVQEPIGGIVSKETVCSVGGKVKH